MERENRQANYELLRIIAMLMVITLHYLNHTGMLPAAGKDAGTTKLAALFIESFCIVAVNVYVMISGYFLSEAGFGIRRLLTLLCQIYFYSLLIPAVMLAAGTEAGWQEQGIYGLLPWFLPLQTEHYWFATSYVILYLLTPVLNAAIKTLNKRQLQITMAGLLLFFSVIKSILPVEFATDSFGYDFGWFLCVYLAGAYIRRHGLPLLSKPYRAWGTYIACSLLTFGLGLAALYIHQKTGSLAYLTALPYHYNFILCLAAAAALFCAFSSVKLSPGRITTLICRISPLTFGVYLFHEHILLRHRWTGYIESFTGPTENLTAAAFLLHWLLSVSLIFITGCLLDAIRLNIFRRTGKHLAQTKLYKKLQNLDAEFK